MIFSERFIQGIDNALAWCEAEEKRIAEEKAKETEKKRKFHYTFWMAITPVVINARRKTA